MPVVYIARIGHERIGADEGAEVGVVVAGVEVVQPVGLAVLLPGEAVIRRQRAATTLAPVGVVLNLTGFKRNRPHSRFPLHQPYLADAHGCKL
jgi:hypothetical protein